MKKIKSIIIVIIVSILSFTSCSKNEDAVQVIENIKETDDSNDIIEENTEIDDYGSGTSNFTAVYEKLIASSTYSHFYQCNSTKFPYDCCLPTAYMIGKGLFGNSQVNNATLLPIIAGMKVTSSGATGTNGFNYAKSDLGSQCADYTLYTYSQAFDKIYNSISAGFPVIALINIKKVNNIYVLETNTLRSRHWVCVVGIRVENFANRTGEISYIDPLSPNRQIKTELVSTFINSSMKASAYNKANLFKIGCQSNAISTNYFGTTNTTTTNNPINNAQNVPIPVAFNWQSAGTNAIYRIQISKTQTGWTASNGFVDDFNRVVNVNTSTLQSFIFSTASSKTNYFWTVKSFVNGVSSSYSSPKSFKTF